MAYVPVKTVTVFNNRLTESSDLTQPLTHFVGKEAYLSVTKNGVAYSLSIGKILNFVANVNLSQSIAQAFTPLLSDAFVEQFSAPNIPIMLPSGLYTKRTSVFNPVAYKDYQVSFTSVDTPDVFDDVTKKGFLDDLAIKALNRDLSQCLVAVNGVFHRTAFQNGVLYVLDGFRTMRLSGRKDVTIVDTKDIGGHTIIPLTTSNVTKSAYQQTATISLNQSIAGKTVFAVIDGYFYHRDQDVLGYIDNTHLKIKTNKTPLIQQFRHNPRVLRRPDLYGDASQSSRKYTDPYELLYLNNPYVLSQALQTADFQYSRLTAFHSFLVVVNNANLYTTSTDVVPTGTPRFYYEESKRNLSGMLNYDCGLCPSYLIWKDPSGRKSIFLPEQDQDIDWQNRTLSPSYIPNLIVDEKQGSKVFAQFIDYVSG